MARATVGVTTDSAVLEMGGFDVEYVVAVGVGATAPGVEPTDPKAGSMVWLRPSSKAASKSVRSILGPELSLTNNPFLVDGRFAVTTAVVEPTDGGQGWRLWR